MILSVFIMVISGHDKPQPSGCLLDVRLPEQFSIIGKLRAHYPVVTLCHVFGLSAAATDTGKTGLKNQTADELYYAVRYLSYMASATVSTPPRLCFPPLADKPASGFLSLPPLPSSAALPLSFAHPPPR